MMIRGIKFSICITSILLLASCKTETQREQYADDIIFKHEADGYLIKQSGDTITDLALEIADDDFTRQTGLMYRDSMDDEQGMLFVFEQVSKQSFYMKNTHIPLDILYLNADSVVTKIYKNAQPGDATFLPSEGPIQFVLELNAGLSDQLDVKMGDRLKRTAVE
jgi:uncharacterized membrane protein (UPF0127 family)